MEIIGHTSSINKNKNALQHFLIAYPSKKVEMDFILTKDGKLVWTHDLVVDGEIVNRSLYSKVNHLLTLEEVLEILNNEIQLLMDIKYFRNSQLDNLMRELTILNNCQSISIQSFNANLIRSLLKLREEIPGVDIGLIINLFKTFYYRNGSIKRLEQIDFLSLSSELWEWKNVGEDYKRYRELFPNSKLYAWTWDALYHESGDRIKNYINKQADGIITTEPALVRALQR